jgi:regulator of sigma E protease
MDVLLSSVIADVWFDWVWPVLQFIIGLGLVVFVHELGHFLVARKVGIHVERFALGFGPRLLGIKRGGTDYCICAFPLGGYVKMLGQEDFAPLEEEAQPDPRSFAAKSVGQRFAVIAAGVVMNTIFAALLFLTVGMIGKDFTAAVVGGVEPGSPAEDVRLRWTATSTAPNDVTPPPSKGLRAGDRFVRFDGDPINRFDVIQMNSLLASEGSTFPVVIERDANGVTWRGEGEVGVKWMPLHNMAINVWRMGIRKPATTVIGATSEKSSPFKPDDRVVSLDGKPVENFWDTRPIRKRMTGEPTTAVVVRDGNEITLEIDPNLTMDGDQYFALETGQRIRGELIDRRDEGDTLVFRTVDGNTVMKVPAKQLAPTEPLEILGLSARLKVSALMDDMPAAEAGMKKGDILVGYGDHLPPTHRQVRSVNKKALGGKTSAIVLRNGKRHTFSLEPVEQDDQALMGVALGYDNEHLVVAGVLENSPAADANEAILPGDEITAVNGEEVATWTQFYAKLRQLQGKPVELTVRRGGETFTSVVTERLTREQFDPGSFIVRLGVAFRPMQVKVSFDNPLSALAWGGSETLRHIIWGYLTIRGLATGNVSHKAVSGPVGMGSMAIDVARAGPIQFLYFMAFISAVLAVMNFLPIPVVDGGHAVFLIIEKIRGKPLPIKVMNIIQIAGLALLGIVFLLLTWQDLARIFGL